MNQTEFEQMCKMHRYFLCTSKKPFSRTDLPNEDWRVEHMNVSTLEEDKTNRKVKCNECGTEWSERIV